MAAVAWVPSRASLAQNPPPAAAPESEVRQYVQKLTQTLAEGAPPQRNEAALRLLEVGTPEARQAITRGLSGRDRRTQLACAQAIADSPSLDPYWVTPLIDLLGHDRPATEAAARALSRYDTDAKAYNGLIQFVQGRQQPYRTAAIGPMGQIVQKLVAQALLNLLGDAAEGPDIRTAAAGALSELSGQTAIGQELPGWMRWWNARSVLFPDQWRTQVLAEQHPLLQFRDEHAREQFRQFYDQVHTLLLEEYDRQAAADKPKVLLGFLDNPDSGIRAIGALIVPVAVLSGQPMPEPVHRRLIELVGDSSPDVRINVATALAALADPNAQEALRVQLQVEKDPDAKVALVQAIARTDGGAVPVLQQLLKDPSERVATAAAEALKSLAPTIQKNAVQRAQVRQDLLTVLQQRTGPPGQPNPQPGADVLRVALIGALAPLSGGDDALEMVNLFSDLLNQNESPRVRQASLQALANFGERGGVTIARELDPTVEPDPAVRQTAASALGDVGSFTFAGQLDNSAQTEPNPDVKKAEWDAFARLTPAATALELLRWNDIFKQRMDWNRQVIVLKAAVTKPQDAASVANEQQTIGELHLRHNQPEQAIPYLRQALDYWQKSNAKPQTIIPLVGQLMNAYLAARQYHNAIQFAGQQIQIDPARQEEVGPRIRDTAERLIQRGNTADAASLINEALQMKPPLDPNYRDQLEILQRQLPPAPTSRPTSD